ncbi:MAG: hypothetical protein M1553_09220 [Firmicutes bacterium]|nr:hypothetical protein [Bacillota bacterium]
MGRPLTIRSPPGTSKLENAMKSNQDRFSSVTIFIALLFKQRLRKGDKSKTMMIVNGGETSRGLIFDRGGTDCYPD